MATFVVRVWLYSDPFETAAYRAMSSEVTVVLGGGLTVPPNLDGLQGMWIPEPSTVALVALGAGAFLLRRRKK